jgi:inner membrane protein
VVYESNLAVKSTFDVPDFTSTNTPDEMILWKDAHIIFGVNDLRGISDNPKIIVGGRSYDATPSNNIGVSMTNLKREQTSGNAYVTPRSNTDLSTKGIVVKLGWENASSFQKDVAINLSLKGSQNLHFIPAGKTTTVQLTSPWQNPSFDGEFLPASREINENGFTATWKVLHFNRPFSQQWTDNNQQLSGADFGVTLLLPVDQYQKSMRTSKYGVLIILLTFVALFLVEITQKIRIHPFQYILIGAALTIYYTLLLSLSEHIGYNIAYAIASVATVLMISLYSISFLRSTRLTTLFTGLLFIFYTFIFVIIQQQDYSLLLGSIGLFLIVGFLMYFSRKVNWYHEATA